MCSFKYKRENDVNKRRGSNKVSEVGKSSVNPHSMIWEKALLWTMLVEEKETPMPSWSIFAVWYLVEDVFDELVILISRPNIHFGPVLGPERAVSPRYITIKGNFGYISYIHVARSALVGIKKEKALLPVRKKRKKNKQEKKKNR